MGLTAKDSGSGGDFSPCPEGLHHAVCYAVYDLGVQHNDMFNVDKEQVLLMWEIPHERMEDGRPFGLSKRYTNSLHEKAALRKDLESWRGRNLTPEELEGFDLSKLVNGNCQLQVNHNTKDGKVYANIMAIVPLSKGMEHLKAGNPTVVYVFGNDVPENAPNWVKEVIAKGKLAKEVEPEVIPEEVSDVEPF